MKQIGYGLLNFAALGAAIYCLHKDWWFFGCIFLGTWGFICKQEGVREERAYQEVKKTWAPTNSLNT